MTVEIKKGGPYTKNEKEKRRENVYRLHFEYGYSARKIAEILNVNRGTINRDIDFCYSLIDKTSSRYEPEVLILESIEKLNIQKTRLRETLDNTTEFAERQSLEKLLLQIESKIIQTQLRLVDSNGRVIRNIEEGTNRALEKNKIKGKLVSTDEFLVCSEKAQMRIAKIIKDDRKFKKI